VQAFRTHLLDEYYGEVKQSVTDELKELVVGHRI
jgi:hypothetical protein